jgi:hypothetical protein
MKAIHAAILAMSAALGAAGCASPAEKAAAGNVAMEIQNYQVIWARGGKLGYLRTYDVAPRNESPVRIHYVLDLDLKTDRGWVSDNGLGERFEYPERKIREAYRSPFERVVLPVDSIENQIKRIIGVDPGTEIALRPATADDVRQQ